MSVSRWLLRFAFRHPRIVVLLLVLVELAQAAQQRQLGPHWQA